MSQPLLDRWLSKSHQHEEIRKSHVIHVAEICTFRRFSWKMYGTLFDVPKRRKMYSTLNEVPPLKGSFECLVICWFQTDTGIFLFLNIFDHKETWRLEEFSTQEYSVFWSSFRLGFCYVFFVHGFILHHARHKCMITDVWYTHQDVERAQVLKQTSIWEGTCAPTHPKTKQIHGVMCGILFQPVVSRPQAASLNWSTHQH